MLNRRFKLHGIFGVLLALSVQIGMGANVPRIEPLDRTVALCHMDDDGSSPPSHSADCLICPLCIILQIQLVVLDEGRCILKPRAALTITRPEQPPPARAPPTAFRPPVQPRAPPLFS